MTQAVALAVLGLRASYFMACLLAFFAYGGPACWGIGQAASGNRMRPVETLQVGLWIGAIGGIAFIGKRVLMAIFFHQQIMFDRGTADAIGTGVGLLLLTLANFLPAWAKANDAGNDTYGRFAACLIAGFGIAFATFYWFAHHPMLTAAKQ